MLPLTVLCLFSAHSLPILRLLVFTINFGGWLLVGHCLRHNPTSSRSLYEGGPLFEERICCAFSWIQSCLMFQYIDSFRVDNSI